MIDDLYHVSELHHDGDNATCLVKLHADHEIYRAHFPGQPVTPGVILLQVACQLLGKVIGQSLEIVAVKNVKFLAVVSPVDNPQVNFSFSHIQADEQGFSARVEVKSLAGNTLVKISFCATPTSPPQSPLRGGGPVIMTMNNEQ